MKEAENKSILTQDEENSSSEENLNENENENSSENSNDDQDEFGESQETITLNEADEDLRAGGNEEIDEEEEDFEEQLEEQMELDHYDTWVPEEGIIDEEIAHDPEDFGIYVERVDDDADENDLEDQEKEEEKKSDQDEEELSDRNDSLKIKEDDDLYETREPEVGEEEKKDSDPEMIPETEDPEEEKQDSEIIHTEAKPEKKPEPVVQLSPQERYASYADKMNQLKKDWRPAISKIQQMYVPSLTDAQAYLKYDDFVENQMDENTEGTLVNKAYSRDGVVEDDGEYYIMDQKQLLVKVQDEKAFQKLKKKTAEYFHKAESFINEQLYSDEDVLGSDLAIGFAQANSLGMVKRTLRGHTPGYLNMKTPLADTALALAGSVNAKLDEEYKSRLKENEQKYPYVSMVCGAEQHLMTMSDYWYEKEKANGMLSPEREQQYRQKLYDQARLLIPLVDKAHSAAVDSDTNEEIQNTALHSQGNQDPFHGCLYSARGSQQLRCTLEANRDGIASGWSVDDLGLLGTFRFIQKIGMIQLKYPGEHTTLESFENIRYDDVEKDADYVTYLTKMEKLYQKIKNTPLTGKEQRDRYLKQMKQLITEGCEKTYRDGKGEEKPYVDKDRANYFNQLYDNMLSREYLITQGKLAAFHPAKVKEDARNNENEVDMRMVDFGAKRSFIFFGWESEQHKNLRKAVQELKQMELDRKDQNKDTFNNDKYLQKLDEIIYYAGVYLKDKKGANTGAGQQRYEGARKFERLAKELREKLVRPQEDEDKSKVLEVQRTDAVKRAAQKALEKLSDLEITEETTKEEKAQIKTQAMEYAADILVAKCALSKNENVKGAFLLKGANVLKKEILASKEFNRIMAQNFKQNMSFEDITNQMKEVKLKEALPKFREQQIKDHKAYKTTQLHSQMDRQQKNIKVINVVK